MAQTDRSPFISLLVIGEQSIGPYYGHTGKPSMPLFSGGQPRSAFTGAGEAATKRQRVGLSRSWLDVVFEAC